MVWPEIPIEAPSPDEVTSIQALSHRNAADSSADVPAAAKLTPAGTHWLSILPLIPDPGPAVTGLIHRAGRG